MNAGPERLSSLLPVVVADLAHQPRTEKAMTDADAIADLVRRMDKAEGERDRYREMVDVAHKWADDRVRDLQAETARREQGLMNALWHALDREPGSERDLIETVRNLARAVPSGEKT